ncbi:MAG: hypothetical protein ACYTHM_03955 [Planctomycetota bacterium]|jgi:hypothetical protein
MPLSRLLLLVLILPILPSTTTLAGEKAPSAPADPVSLVCKTFLDRRHWSRESWVTCWVEVKNRGGTPAAVKVGIVPGKRTRPPDSRWSTAAALAEVTVVGGSTKRFFLYLPPALSSYFTVHWSVQGVLQESTHALAITGNPSESVLVISEKTDGRKRIVAALQNQMDALASPAKDLPDRPEGYDQFRIVILHDTNPAVLPLPVRRALRDWTVRGGLLILSPGPDAGLFLDPVLKEIHPFRPVDTLPPLRIASLGELEPTSPPAPQVVQVLEGGEAMLRDAQGFAVARWAPVGLGGVLGFATSLEILRHLSMAGLSWFNITLLDSLAPPRAPITSIRFPGRNPVSVSVRLPAGWGRVPASPFPGGEGNAGGNAKPGTGVSVWAPTAEFFPVHEPSFRFLLHAESMRYGSDVEDTPYQTFRVAMARQVAGAPGIAFVAFVLFVFVILVGPLNYLFLRRRRAPALSALTIPFLSITFVILIVVVGLLTKGGTKGNRLTILETKPGQSWATVTSLTYFRTGGQGEYGLSAGEGVFPLPQIPTYSPFRLDQTGGDRLVLPLNRWAVSGMQTESALQLPGKVDVSWEGNTIRIVNHLPLDLRDGLLTPPPGVVPPRLFITDSGIPIFTKGISVPAKQEKVVPILPSKDPTLTEEDEILGFLLMHQNAVLSCGGFAAWITLPREVPQVNGDRLHLVDDRAVCVVAFRKALTVPGGGGQGR